MKTIVYIGTSLDGFIARKDGNIDWLMKFASAEVFKPYEELTKRIDTILMGRNTFNKVLTFPSWPYKKKIHVLSKSLTQIPKKYKDKVTVLSLSPIDALKHLSKNGYSTIYVDGGSLIQSFLKDDLIDELIISKVPVLIGDGISLFGFLDSDLEFKHLKTESFSNGLVMSFYERQKK
ncbi:dihydrofolate reductase [Ginsengibacter hankyongi]|uniref:Dihydrofolate reductase n=1 Tax=Ginsengibacter hankyongi TaxID=2607284 RepID=A0A5J5IDK4_9BACT|nr:dihydrofolate reductase family protein [Ginsengibacter hankyongi]KAA9035910.1 dihydrofolate reductase [Ginsengibacter hankyongi]